MKILGKFERIAGRFVCVQDIADDREEVLRELIEGYGDLLPPVANLVVRWSSFSSLAIRTERSHTTETRYGTLDIADSWWDLSPYERRKEFVTQMQHERWDEKGLICIGDDDEVLLHLDEDCVLWGQVFADYVEGLVQRLLNRQ